MKRRTWWLPVAAMVLAAGCGTTTPPSPSTANPSAGPVVLDVTIIDGEVTPRGARVNLKVGQSLTLSVHSDVKEEIHIHGDPELTVPIKAGKQERVTFAADRPGKVAVEVHELDVVVAELLIRK